LTDKKKIRMLPAADILVTHGTVLTMDAAGTRIDDGAVAIAGDRILAAAPAERLAGVQAKKVIDAHGGIIMPGLVNTHTHAAMTCFRGLADDLPLMTWLNDHIFPAEARLTPEMVTKGALLGCAEMILSGTTCFCDMYLFEEAVARAAHAAGLRAVVGEVLFDFPSPNYGAPENGLAYTRRMAAKWVDDPLIGVAVEPHSPYLCAPDLLCRAADLARELHLPLVTHLSETAGEVAQIRSRYGRTPVGHLAHLGILAPNLLACHCVQLTPEDIALLQAADVKIAHNPESNMKLASGIAPVPALLAAGLCVALGTDGCASNNDLDLFLEMDTAAKLHKVATLDPTALPAEQVLKMATIDGARALGLEAITGSLEPGKRADLIVIDCRKPHLTPLYHPASHLVYAARGGDVDTVVINGRLVMEKRELRTLDLERITADVRAIAAQIGAASR
jgi:5-methylthioadenosine/S-adenosylhomocysteine deaminase